MRKVGSLLGEEEGVHTRKQLSTVAFIKFIVKKNRKVWLGGNLSESLMSAWMET